MASVGIKLSISNGGILFILRVTSTNPFVWPLKKKKPVAADRKTVQRSGGIELLGTCIRVQGCSVQRDGLNR